MHTIETEFNFLKSQACAPVNLSNPDFENTRRVHDWRNRVADIFINTWDRLTERERMIIFIIAEQEASSEKYDLYER